MTSRYVRPRITLVGQSMTPSDDGLTVHHTASMKGVGAGPTMGMIAALRTHTPEHAQLTLKGAGSTGDPSQDTWEVLLEWDSPLAAPAPAPYATGALPHAGHKPGCRCMKPRDAGAASLKDAGDAFRQRMGELQDDYAQKGGPPVERTFEPQDARRLTGAPVERTVGQQVFMDAEQRRRQEAVDAQRAEYVSHLEADHERITRDWSARARHEALAETVKRTAQERAADRPSGPVDGSKAAEMDYSRTLSARNRQEHEIDQDVQREQEYRQAFEEEQGG